MLIFKYRRQNGDLLEDRANNYEEMLSYIGAQVIKKPSTKRFLEKAREAKLQPLLLKRSNGKIIYRAYENRGKIIYRAYENRDSDEQPKTKAEPNPVEKTEPKPAGDLGSLLAKEIEKHLDLQVDQKQLETLHEQIKSDISSTKDQTLKAVTEALEEFKKQQPREIVVKTPDGKRKEVGRQHKEFETLLAFVSQRINTLIVGPAGSGKSTAAAKVAKALSLNFYAISVGMMTTKTDFLGYTDAHGVYHPTQFRKAFEHGGVFLLDEVDAGNANVITTINMALANGSAAFPDGMIPKHKDFILIAGGNTFGTGANREYVGRNQLDAATLDRFAVIEFGYDEALEIELAGDERWTKYIQAIRANAERYKVRVVISPRMSINGARMLAAGMSFDNVVKYVVKKGLPAHDLDKLFKDVKY